MAVTFVDVTAYQPGSVTSLSMPWADLVGEANDDIAIAFIFRTTQAPLTPPSGWNQLAGFPQTQSTGGFKYEMDVYWHRVVGGEATATWSWTGAATAELHVTLYRGMAAGGAPILAGTVDVEAAQNTQPSHSGITVINSTSALIYCAWNLNATADTGDPSGYIDPGGGAARAIFPYYKLSTAAGATGAVGVNLTDPEYAASDLFELLTTLPVSAVVTGTATAAITEADVVAGGKTIITTLTNDTFIADTVPTAAFSSGTAKSTTTAPGRASTGDITATLPATPTVGQFGIVICYLDAGTATISAGWTLVTGAPWGSATPKLYIWTRVMLTGDTSPTVTIAGAGVNDSSCVNVALYDGIGSVVTIGAATTGTGTASTAAQITGAAIGNIILGIIGRGDNENASGQTFGGSGTGVVEVLDGGTDQGNDSQISMCDKTLTATGATGALSVTTAATDPYIGIILELAVATLSPYKVAAVNHWVPLIDSAQAEANGWDARVQPAFVAANFVRTSATVTTITLPAVATYDITAQETITDTVPAGILTGGAQIVATPTFTVAPVVAGQPALGGIARERRSPRNVYRRRVYYN